MDVTLSLTDAADESIRQAILGPLVAFNDEKAGNSGHRPLVVAISDSRGEVVGGLWGRTSYAWLFIELLFVPESLRGRGVGRELVRRAEQEAVSRGCRNAWLDTFGFQGRGFYERLGFKCFGELRDYPPGFSRHFMAKVLE